MPKHPKKKHGKGFFDDLVNTAANVADHFDLFGTQAAEKKRKEAEAEAERLRNRSGLEKIGDLAWNVAGSVLPELGSYLVKQISGGNKEPLLGEGRAYTAEEWEQKLCKGENSLLAQKKRKIKERAEKGVPALETPMRTSRVIKATPPKEAEKYYFMFRGDGGVFIMTPEQVIAPDFIHRVIQTIDSNNRAKAQENKSRKGTMAGLLRKTDVYPRRDGDHPDRVAGIAQEAFKEQSTLHNFNLGSEYSVSTLKRYAKKVSADEYDNLKKEGRILEKGRDKWSLGSGKPVLAPQDVLEGKKDGGQRFMANRAVPNKVPNVVRVREMNEVRNYNRDQQRKVFENEKRQVQSESESIKPIDAKDAGAAFKLQTYLSKVSQILAQKNDLFAQVSATPFTDLDQLKGTTKQAALLTMLASKAEFVQAFNEMVAYVSLFFKDIQQDNRVRDRMYSAYFTPLMDQMKQVAAQYPTLFTNLPAPERGRPGQPPSRQGRVYDTVRNELRDMYSLLMLAAQNIQAGIFRPLSAKDVGEYTIENNVSAQFQRNPAPPSAPVPSMAVQQAQQAVAMADAQRAAAAAQAQELALRDPFNPAGDMTLDPRQGQQFQLIRTWARGVGADPDQPLRIPPPVEEALQMNEQQAAALQPYLQLGIILNGLTPQQGAAEIQRLQAAGNMANLEAFFTRLYQTARDTLEFYNNWRQTREVLEPQPGEGEVPVGRDEGAREATDDDIDEAVRRFVADNNYPPELKLPQSDSGRGEFGGERWRPLATIRGILEGEGLEVSYNTRIKRAITRYNATRERRPRPGGAVRPPQREPVLLDPEFFEPGEGAAAEPVEEEEQEGAGMSGGRLYRSHAGRELDFVPAPALNSAAPPYNLGYGSHHRPKFAWEMEQELGERRGGYIRQDRVPYVVQGGLGMVNPDNEIGTFQVLRMAGEVGRGMSGGVYLPKEYVVQPRGEVTRTGYGVDGDDDMFGEMGGYGSLKRRLGMPNPFANSHDYHYRNVDSGYDDKDDFAYGRHEEPIEAAQAGHEEEEEKPVDLDENPNPFRVRNENYKVNTGKMKKVTYKTYDK